MFVDAIIVAVVHPAEFGQAAKVSMFVVGQLQGVGDAVNDFSGRVNVLPLF